MCYEFLHLIKYVIDTYWLYKVSLCASIKGGERMLCRPKRQPAEASSEVLEERLADAAETVPAEQIGSESGDELLAPAKKHDDPIALEDPS